MTKSAGSEHLPVLDGWRGVSILLVLATHLLPVGPKAWRLNENTGAMGMAIFFVLSGFLITRFLLEHTDVLDFLIRRVFRIVPLAWLALVVSFVSSSVEAQYYLPNLFFYANLPPQQLTDIASHYWSLCVEMQFYVGIALVVAVLGRRGLFLLPLICVAVTIHRVIAGATIDIVTWRRADEILAGACVALVFSNQLGDFAIRCLKRTNFALLILAFALASHPASGFLNFLRPYFAAILVGVSLYDPPGWATKLLRSRVLRYLAKVSFGVYVFHHLLMYSWLGEGDKITKYLKRPLLFSVTFLLAHWSTFYFERRFIFLGKSLSAWTRRRLSK
jgi:peptidoglycan/LPS O-acetylase OafA/YrhL